MGCFFFRCLFLQLELFLPLLFHLPVDCACVPKEVAVRSYRINEISKLLHILGKKNPGILITIPANV